MRHLVLSLLALMPIASCATAHSHFDDVVRVAASKHPRDCTAPYTVQKLNGWAYRVDACEGPLYYRCAFDTDRDMVGRRQCCEPMRDEGSATALVGPAIPRASSTCLDFAD
jgi:hypothetical protein